MKKIIITLFSALLVLVVSNPLAAQDDITVPLSKPGQKGMLRIDLVYADDIIVQTHDRQDVIVKYNGDDDDDNWNNRKNGFEENIFRRLKPGDHRRQ